MSRYLALSIVIAAAAGCEPSFVEPAGSGIDPLYSAFLDGKLDALGHPVGATVFAFPDACDGGCSFDLEAARGTFVANIRALGGSCSGSECDAAAVSVAVFRGDTTVASKIFRRDEFDAGVSRNLPVPFTLVDATPVTVRLEALHEAVEIEYLEVFRQMGNVVLDPPSGPHPEGGKLSVDYQTTEPEAASFSVRCNGQDYSSQLENAFDDGRATKEAGEFRALVTFDVDDLLADCELPREILVTARTPGHSPTTARVTYGVEAPACSFAPSGRRVLLTGFEPFPADATGDNSSEQAVLAFDPASVPDGTFMRMILPVEWATASAMVADVIERCEPEVVISFGQGRYTIDVEKNGYNLMDTSSVPGGVPDNRGVIELGSPIWPGGPAEISSSLPVSKLVSALDNTSFGANKSNDPGRYICNNLFYDTLSRHGDELAAAGFIHLPIIHHVSNAERAELAQVVRIAVQKTLDSI